MSDEEPESDAGRVLPIDGVLDLHAFRPRDVADLVPTWIDACRDAGIRELRIVHGKGRGVQRRTVHAILQRRSDVHSYRLAPQERGGWGATLVTLCDDSQHLGASPTSPERESAMLEFGRTAENRTLDARQLLPTSLAELFPFFADPRNLQALTPPFLRFELLPPTPTPAQMREGALLDYRLTLRGIPVTWRTRISVWEPPSRFVDEQLHGPYLLWRHEHRFEPRGDGETLVLDHVDYRVPGGALIDWLLVQPDLRRIFTYRSAQLAARFGRRSEHA